MKLQRINKSDGFVLFNCVIGACPEIKQVGEEYVVRSSRNPGAEVTFTRAELATLKVAIADYI